MALHALPTFHILCTGYMMALHVGWTFNVHAWWLHSDVVGMSFSGLFRMGWLRVAFVQEQAAKPLCQPQPMRPMHAHSSGTSIFQNGFTDAAKPQLRTFTWPSRTRTTVSDSRASRSRRWRFGQIKAWHSQSGRLGWLRRQTNGPRPQTLGLCNENYKSKGGT